MTNLEYLVWIGLSGGEIKKEDTMVDIGGLQCYRMHTAYADSTSILYREVTVYEFVFKENNESANLFSNLYSPIAYASIDGIVSIRSIRDVEINRNVERYKVIVELSTIGYWHNKEEVPERHKKNREELERIMCEVIKKETVKLKYDINF